MANTYDRVSGKYLINVIRRFIFRIPKWSPSINHLSYADDTILLCSRHPTYMSKMIKNVPTWLCNQIKRITGVRRSNFSFTYLECPIFYGMKNKGHLEDFKKAVKMMNLWQNRLMLYGERYLLIDHDNDIGSKNKHWVSWDSMYYPKEGGRLRFRSLHDVSKTLLSSYIWNKYYEKFHPIIAARLNQARNSDFIIGQNKRLYIMLKLEYIMESIKPPSNDYQNDILWWMGNTQENSTIK
ncbi:hypothetical protein H5410_045006 [Solanum commersonii]|uniref:Reverse transcriptase domain-containing protein n=1 Tax=Solanum commersonii TaxID=4109 RepID=A0A9J5XBJ2_SOLCO|nr:hypothetical protein H5410_045006 [Solanum commersonii]